MPGQSDGRNKKGREWPAEAIFCTNGHLGSILTASAKDQKGSRVAFTDKSRLARTVDEPAVDAAAELLLPFTRSLGAPVADEGVVAILEAGRYPKPRLQSRSRTTEKREDSRHPHSLGGG